MTMGASNGLGSCGARWRGPRRWNDGVGAGLVPRLGRGLLAYCHARFEEILSDLMGYVEAEDRNTLGQMVGRNQERMPAQMALVAEELGRGDRVRQKVLVDVISVVGMHGKKLVPEPVLAKLGRRVLRFEEVRDTQEHPSHGLHCSENRSPKWG